MDRFDAASEPSFPRGTRSSYHHVSSSGYASALSSHIAFDAAEPVSREGYGLGSMEGHSERGFGKGHSEHGYGGYSYSSSYDDVRKSAYEGGLSYEDSKPFEASAYGKYGYGLDKGSVLGGSYEDPSFDPLHRAASGLLPSSYGGFDGSRSVTKHRDLLHQGISDSYASQYHYSDLSKTDFNSLSKPDFSYYEPSAAVRARHTTLQPHESTYPFRDSSVISGPAYSTPGAATEYQQSSGLSRHYNSSFSGTSSTFGALGDWRDPVGRVHDSDGNGWQQSRTVLSNAQELYAFGKSGIGSEIENGGIRDLNKFGKWDGGVHAQADADQKGSLTETGSKIADYNEDSLRATKEKKKRLSRWEPVEENEKSAQDGSEKKKKKSRWSEEKPPAKEVNLTDVLKQEDGDRIALRAQLIVINRKLQSGKVVDERPEAERSPSPEPVFDNFGYRVNTREFRAREKLTNERKKILTKLAEKVPSFKPPPDFKQSKFSRKLPIPVDKYPDYNFVGLIIGPRGHTQKKMEKESGAKIFIRGKGSLREGSSSTISFPGESENLHVLIEADTEDSVNKAAGMVEKLLVPLEDGQNEHKKAQLRELASLNGTLRTTDLCHVCKEIGHLAKYCPMASVKRGSSAVAVQKEGTSQDNVNCQICKGYGHLSKDCPSWPPSLGILPKDWPLGSGGFQVTESDLWINNDRDDALLYVACLPVSVNEAVLQSLFLPFGRIVDAKVMRHPSTGISKSYGFVKFQDAADAAQAVTVMNGYKFDGKVLLVKLRSSVEAVS